MTPDQLRAVLDHALPAAPAQTRATRWRLAALAPATPRRGLASGWLPGRRKGRWTLCPRCLSIWLTESEARRCCLPKPERRSP